MKFTVNYLATDGNVRWMEVEADDEEQAKEAAWKKDAETNSCGDNIMKIVSVE